MLGERHPGFGGREVIHLGFRSQRRDLSHPAAGPFFFLPRSEPTAKASRSATLGSGFHSPTVSIGSEQAGWLKPFLADEPQRSGARLPAPLNRSWDRTVGCVP